MRLLVASARRPVTSTVACSSSIGSSDENASKACNIIMCYDISLAT